MMAMLIFNAVVGDSRRGTVVNKGNGDGLRRVGKMGNSAVITGTVVLLLVGCFVGDCGGKPFHSVGQAEVEEDTTQGSLKEKFPLPVTLRSSISQLGNDVNGIGGEDYDGINPDILTNADLVAVGNDRNSGDNWPSSASLLVPGSMMNKDESQKQQQQHHHLLRHLNFPSNYGSVHKRSLGARPLSFSASSRNLAPGVGRNEIDSDADDDEIELDDGEDLRRQRRQGFLSSSSSSFSNNPQPSSPDVITSTGGGGARPSSRIRQRLLNLRNQYGDKWFAFVNPYAYRKRQILYRQCFFNPISCF